MYKVILPLILCSCATTVPVAVPKPPPPKPVQKAAVVPEPEALRNRFARSHEKNGKPDMFGVIIGGYGQINLVMANVSVAYQSLLELGFEADNIYVLAPGGAGTPWYYWTDYLTKDSLELLFATLGEMLEEHDSLAVYVTGVGFLAHVQGTDAEKTAKMYDLPAMGLNSVEAVTHADMGRVLASIAPASANLLIDVSYWGVFEDLPCSWQQVSGTVLGVEQQSTQFGRYMFHLMARADHTTGQAVERIASLDTRDTLSVKICRHYREKGSSEESRRRLKG